MQESIPFNPDLFTFVSLQQQLPPKEEGRKSHRQWRQVQRRQSNHPIVILLLLLRWTRSVVHLQNSQGCTRPRHPRDRRLGRRQGMASNDPRSLQDCAGSISKRKHRKGTGTAISKIEGKNGRSFEKSTVEPLKTTRWCFFLF